MIVTIRDISIIFLALESIVVLALLSILIVQIRNLVILLNEEIKPMLEATNETAATVRNTTTFMSKRVAKPFVSIISFGAGVRQAAATLKKDVSPSAAPLPPPSTIAPPAPGASPPLSSSDELGDFPEPPILDKEVK